MPRRRERNEDALAPPTSPRTAPLRGLGIDSSRASLPGDRSKDRGTRTGSSRNVGLPSSPPSPSPRRLSSSTSSSRQPPAKETAMSEASGQSGRGQSSLASSPEGGKGPSQRTVSGSKRRREETGADSTNRESAVVSSSRIRSKSSSDRLELGRASRTRLSGEELSSRRYTLRIIQSPNTGAAFGTNLLARLALAPPLVVELVVTNSEGVEIPATDELSHLVCHVALLTESGQAADLLSPVSSPSTSASPGDTQSSGPTPPSRRASLARRASRRTSGGSSRSRSSGESQRSSQPETPAGPLRMLYGTLVASPQQLFVLDRTLRCLFLFPEVSVRARGRYRLQVTLMRIPLPEVVTPNVSPTLATVVAPPFQVVLSPEFVAPHITPITQHLVEQGVGLLVPPGQALEE